MLNSQYLADLTNYLRIISVHINDTPTLCIQTNIINVAWLVLFKLILLYSTKTSDRQDCEKCEEEKKLFVYSTVSSAQPYTFRWGAA